VRNIDILVVLLICSDFFKIISFYLAKSYYFIAILEYTGLSLQY